MSAVPPFFPGHWLNYAENILTTTSSAGEAGHLDSDIAMIGLREARDCTAATMKEERVSWSSFRERVRVVASALKRSGVKQGDVVAALVATSVWAAVLFHAAASMGAVFTCISPELGVQGCLVRLQQVRPKVLFADSHAFYNGKVVDCAAKIQEVVRGLTRPLVEVFVIPLMEREDLGGFESIDRFLHRADKDDPLTFARVPFNHPLLICYSSGTTGPPKCMVHQHGIILQIKKMSMIHNCLGKADVVLQYSSTSWIVFYAVVGHLSVGATTILYNGSPMFPNATQLLRLSEKYKVTTLGASPRLLLEMEMSGTVPRKDYDLRALKTLHSTGAPLSVEQYRWIYKSFPADVQVSNCAGGTENGTATIVMDPAGPVYAGEMQMLALGMDLDILHPDTGESIADTGEAGELVIRQPYPSMPCFFWGDKDGSVYHAAYFKRFPKLDVWAQHDWLKKGPATGGFQMLGRSDGILSECKSSHIENKILNNLPDPSGIRFGSGEIYAVVERPPFTSLFDNCVCVGRRRPDDVDEQVFLFVVTKDRAELSSQVVQSIKAAIRSALSPRHVPKFILSVPDIPMTVNGKRVETALKQVISGQDVTPSATVQNPKSLQYFKRFRDVEAIKRDVVAKL